MIPAVAKAPAASAIQTRSNTIQRPHGYVFERFVLPPSPRRKREPIESSPIATSSSIAQLKGVISLRFSVSNVGWCSRAAAEVRRLKNEYVVPSRAPMIMTAGGTAPSATFDFAGYGSSPSVGKPSFSNGTDER